MPHSLEERLGYRFRDPRLLRQALIHSSYWNEHRSVSPASNERLEFLGDAVLELASSRYLYEKYPDYPEGKLSRLRSQSVCEPSLAACARRLRLGEELRLGRGETASGGAARDSLLSDCLEAVIGAMYLDAGFTETEQFVRREVMDYTVDAGLFDDAKTRLQEQVQSEGVREISYRTVQETGPEHRKTFTVDVFLDDRYAGRGSGHSKKAAEQAAAAEALRLLSPAENSDTKG